MLADLLLIKLAKDRSSVERASLLVCGATFNHNWGDKSRLVVSVARPLVDTPIFLGGRQFGGVYEISQEGIPGRLFLLCDDERRAQEPEVARHPDSQVATYTYQVYDSKCSGTTDIVYNAVRDELYSFGRPYNSPSGSTRISRLNLGSRVTDLLANTHKAYFDRISWMAASNDGKLLASEKYDAGLELFVLDRAKKVALPRYAAQPLTGPSESRKPRLFFGKTGEVWITRPEGTTLWAVPEADGSQFDFVSLMLGKPVDIDVSYARQVGDYYVEQVRSLVDDEKMADATKLRDRAVAKDATLQPRLDAQLALFSFRKGVAALTSQKNDDAERYFAETLNLAAAMKPQIDAAWGKGFFDRGRSRFDREQFVEAIEAFQAASLRGHSDADKWIWFSIMRRSDQLRDSGAAVQALLMAMNGYFDLSSKTRAVLDLTELKMQLPTITNSLAEIFQQDPASTRIGKDANRCDVLAAHALDPLRTTAPAEFDKIDAKAAIAACDEAIESNQKEGRFYFQRARGHAKAAANSARDNSVAEKHRAARRLDLGASMELGYPYAFVAQGVDYEEGFGVAKDMDKAADHYLQGLNRTLACCVVAAANELIAAQQNTDFPSASRAAHALVSWAAALGSAEARALLSKWEADGEFRSGKVLNNPKWDSPPWLLSSEVRQSR